MSGSIKLNNLSYVLPNGVSLFSGLNYAFSEKKKVAIIGNNGVGKSTLLKIIAGEIKGFGGTIVENGKILYIPQDITRLNGYVADILEVSPILDSIKKIEKGETDPLLFEIVGQHWNIEQEIQETFNLLQIKQSLSDDFDSLSGGEKEKILLAKCYLSEADFIILDEPTNNLDVQTKVVLYDFILNYKRGIIVVSHDRTLLNKMSEILELTASGLKVYGGNYEFYQAERNHEIENLEQKKVFLTNENQKLIKTKNKMMEQQNKSASEGAKAIQNKKYSKLVGNALRGSSESSFSKKSNSLDSKIQKNRKEIYQIGWDLTNEKIKIPIPDKPFIKAKLLDVRNVCFGYDEHYILKDISFSLAGDECLQIKGANGCGKSTLIRLIIGELTPKSGAIYLNGTAIYLNQNLSLLDRNKTLLENMLEYNSGISIMEAHSILANFKFRNVQSDKKVSCLSGGELLRATLATVLGTQKQPDLIILDEPTNNLDIQSIEVLESSLQKYQGAIIVVSHDEEFIKNLAVTKALQLD